jgi:methionyl-tRNA formyltransferase
MFESIILLTGPVEQSALASTLCRHNPGLTVKAVETAADLAALERDTLRRARLIGFATPVIVPPDILQALGYGAYNFHPGPPQYPGFAPAQFAIYDQAAEFGATVHEMADRVDSGPIVDVARFSVPAGISVIELETLAYMQLVEMFWRLAQALATQADPLPGLPLHWSNKRNSRRAYRAACDIPLDIGRDDLHRRIHAFGGNHYDMAPAIHLHGVEFRAVVPSQDPAADRP